jgi:hypothetical protein
MAVYVFKLLGGTGVRSEMDIEIPMEKNVGEIKEIVRKEFHIAPMISIDLMAGGKKLSDGMNWAMVPARPYKDTILVIGYRNDV